MFIDWRDDNKFTTTGKLKYASVNTNPTFKISLAKAKMIFSLMLILYNMPNLNNSI